MRKTGIIALLCHSSLSLRCMMQGRILHYFAKTFKTNVCGPCFKTYVHDPTVLVKHLSAGIDISTVICCLRGSQFNRIGLVTCALRSPTFTLVLFNEWSRACETQQNHKYSRNGRALEYSVRECVRQFKHAALLILRLGTVHAITQFITLTLAIYTLEWLLRRGVAPASTATHSTHAVLTITHDLFTYTTPFSKFQRDCFAYSHFVASSEIRTKRYLSFAFTLHGSDSVSIPAG
jgi:hypothetical protein